jgi:hypothetical protein
VAKKTEIYTVRDASGQFLGTYRASNAKHAIGRYVDEQQHASVFKGGKPVSTERLTATVEPSPDWVLQQAEYDEETRMLNGEVNATC